MHVPAVADGAVHDYCRNWRRDGTWERIHARLREQVRKAAGREAVPEIAVLDSQSVKMTERGGEAGFGAGKKCSDENGTCCSIRWD